MIELQAEPAEVDAALVVGPAGEVRTMFRAQSGRWHVAAEPIGAVCGDIVVTPEADR